MQWFVEVTDVTGEYSLVIAILERAGYYKLSTEEHAALGRLLSHPKYESFETASEVHADAKQLSETLRRFSELDGTPLGIRFGAVQSRQPDGRTNKHAFGKVRAAFGVTVSATGTVIPNPATSEEKRRRLIEEMQAKAAEQKRMSVIRRASAALHHPRMLEVMKLMSIVKPTTTELGHIVDLVQDECGGDLEKYETGKQLKRFSRSINHPDVFGLDARHAVSAKEPPPEPMDYAEAKAFAHKIGALWLSEFERDA